MLPARSSGLRYAVGLYRVSTAEQGQSGLGLEAQQASVRAFVAAQGWTLVAEHSDIASGKDERRRWHAAVNSARCWLPPGWTASPSALTRSPACWRRATRSGRLTCRAPMI
jgi:hypothetical protein